MTTEALKQLKALALAANTWVLSLKDVFQLAPDKWAVGYVDEDGNQYDVGAFDTGQYDRGEDAEMLARYYGAVDPATILELLAEIERLSAVSGVVEPVAFLIKSTAEDALYFAEDVPLHFQQAEKNNPSLIPLYTAPPVASQSSVPEDCVVVKRDILEAIVEEKTCPHGGGRLPEYHAAKAAIESALSQSTGAGNG